MWCCRGGGIWRAVYAIRRAYTVRVLYCGALRAQLGGDIDTDPAYYPSWRTIFRLLADLATDEPLVVVLDEFQYLMAREEDIVQAAGLGDRANAVRRVAVLEGLELIARERHFDAHEKAARQHRIADPAVRFWHRFVLPNRSRLETGGARQVWATRVAPLLNDYMGKVFEGICRDGYVRRHEAWGLAGAVAWSRWEGRDRHRRPIEVDLVARLDDGRLLTGEMKWSTRPVGAAVRSALLRNLQDLALSGQGWAADALSASRSAGHLFFSAAGFTDDVRARAAGDERIRLVTLEDRYGG